MRRDSRAALRGTPGVRVDIWSARGVFGAARREAKRGGKREAGGTRT